MGSVAMAEPLIRMCRMFLVGLVSSMALSFPSLAQKKPQYEAVGSQSFGRIGVKYRSDNVFLGRADSLPAPYFTSQFGYYHKSGLFLDVAASYLATTEERRIDVVTLSGGYDYLGNALSVGGSLSGYFFNENSYAVQSTLTGFLNSYLGYDFGVLELVADGSLALSTRLDILTGLELRRTFYFLSDRFTVTPSFLANAGTQYYYEEYYSTRNSQITKGNTFGKKQGKAGGTSSEVVTVQDTKKFRILDYELSVYAVFKVRQFRLMAVPSFAIPVNPSTVSIDQTVFEEDLKNRFFWSLGVGYVFGFDGQ